MGERRVGINCDRCGRFVGRDGVVNTYEGDRWAYCRRCRIAGTELSVSAVPDVIAADGGGRHG